MKSKLSKLTIAAVGLKFGLSPTFGIGFWLREGKGCFRVFYAGF